MYLQSLRRYLQSVGRVVPDGSTLSAGAATTSRAVQVPVQHWPARPGAIQLPRSAFLRIHEDTRRRKS